uniref:Retrotransposon-derived protein PEG10 (inferred by orthology to a human protein) n=1 Tax=Strongyloides venezuelensis TaxID=75913 RepID=A0A0K0FEE1_STRVS
MMLSFDLSISPSIFQTIINDIVEDLDLDKIFIYLDDLLIATETEEKHWTPYLGFIISEKELSADPIKIKKTLDFFTSKSKKQLQSFLENNFVTIKNELLKAPILSASDIKKALSGEAPFELYTDASFTGIGAVLMQNKKIIIFYNRGLRESEKNYPPTDLESLAVVSELENLKIILFGAPITVYSNHSALSVLFQKSDISL